MSYCLSDIFASGVRLAHQRLSSILVDVVWRGIWLALSVMTALAVISWFGSEFATLEWQGPDLGVGRTMMLVVALQQLWQEYVAVLAAAIVGFAILVTILWLVLEAYFRGGRSRFWVFLGSGFARLSILITASVLLGILAYRGSGALAVASSILVLFAIALVLVIAETLIREDAVELWATDLVRVTAAVGISFVLELLSLSAILTIGLAMLSASSRSVEVLLSAAMTIGAFAVWSLFHSYLIVVRRSTIDIMRHNVHVTAA
jgi:hypothetical protein